MPFSSGNRSIVHIADYAPTYSGNFIASLKCAAAECRERGYKIVWVFPDDVINYSWFKELRADTSAYTLSRGRSTIIHAWKIAQIAAAENAAIVHTHFSRFDVAARLAKTLCALTGCHFELVWHVHSGFPLESSRLRQLKDYLKLGLLGRACCAIPVSEAVAASLIERRFSRRRIHIVSNGVDIAHATARTTEAHRLRAELDIPGESAVLLGFGWAPLVKGVDTMLETVEQLAREGVKIVLVLVGTDDLVRFLDAWPSRWVKAFIRVIPPRECVGDLFGIADAFLAPSRREGWPYSIAEAMVNRVPVASSDIPALAWAANAPGIFFSPVGDGPQLTSSVRSMLQMPPQGRAHLGELAMQFVSGRHTVQKWGQSIWRVYQDLLPRGASIDEASSNRVGRAACTGAGGSK